MRVSKIISELLYPSGIKCVICGDELSSSSRYAICDGCEPSYNVKYCERCGRAMKNAASFCEDCKNYPRTFDFARAPFVYEGNVKKPVYKFKYGGGKYLADVMCEFMADTYYESGFEADCVCYVPMYPTAELKRGYNQAKLLAYRLSELISVPVCDALVKVKDLTHLAKMSREERAEAIEKAFAVTDGSLVYGKNVLLVDDVFTTGSTSGDCSRALRGARCGKIMVLSFATARMKPELY